MGCSCKGFRLVSACRGMVLGTAPSGFLDRVPCQRLKGSLGPFGGAMPGPCLLWGLQLVHLAAYRPPDAPAMLFSAPSAPAAAISRRSATPSWICSSLVGEIP